MTDQEARYDRIAEGYATWWAPVHRPSTLHLLDLLEPESSNGPVRMVDVGCGTGVFAAAAVHRWPGIEVDGTDVSAGMLAVAERARASLPEDRRWRFRLHQAPADRLPFGDASHDIATSSFVLQLVPSRFRALREMHRVLRPGGRIGITGWLEGGPGFAADEAYDAALEAAGFESRPSGGGHSDFRSPAHAESILRRAGFSAPRAKAAELTHQFTPESYLEFIARFDDEDLFTSLDAEQREMLEADVLARLRALRPGALRMVLPVVYATATRR
jgi:ubiquinone/menaquinone biosynthesis C-methylase UbiE